MAWKKGISPGFSLTELVVAFVVGAIFFFMLGLVLIYTQESWLRARDTNALWNDYRYSKRKMEYLIRQAGTGGFTIWTSSFDFNTVNFPGTARTNRVWLDNRRVFLDSWNTFPPAPPPTARHELLLDKVDDLRFQLLNSDAVQITIVQRSSGAYTNSIMSSTRTFTIERRN